ncbi:N-acetylglucosamine-6-phosphate deacetylase [uncultured Endozoicomonas sp.]|uniref:N-acetylglucosamine-6-phosphate deacetylase n=1 Tax=uncultured Endozoicomonas sp. TaxID=432652 RepID=UPI00260B570A|nr:N-acetylglucosamine-6-phosphate deacetylase [uncultured Endozoicomonas sp.]
MPAESPFSPEQTYALVNFKPLTGQPEQPDFNAIIIDNGRISATCSVQDIPENVEKIDLHGLTVSPGFIDLQLNGCGGVLFNADISADTLDTMHEANLRSGCTAFLPTLITSVDEDMRRAIQVTREYMAKHPDRIPGAHLEGPYLNKERKGIHDPEIIRTPSAEMIDYICDNADVVAMMTLAPESCPEGTIEKLSKAGIVVSLGHTNATCAQAKIAEQAGASFATHLHNAMSPLGSREPGVVGAVFDSQRLGAGIIADGHHLAFENLRIAHRIMGDRLVLVTDATTPAGTEMETFLFAGQTIYHKDGKCTNADGTLAGSALTMIEAVANSIDAGIDANAVIRMATINAARAIHQAKNMGSIAIGQYANLAIFNDSFQMRGTVSGGTLKLNQQ